MMADTPDTLPETFRLLANSLAINSAHNIFGVQTDFEKKNRGSNHDMGAIE